MRTLGVAKEQASQETRVALVPEAISPLIKKGDTEVLVERGAGEKAGFLDEEYQEAGAKIIDQRAELVGRSSTIVAINGAELFSDRGLASKLVISLFDPYFNLLHIQSLKDQGASVLSLELVPRISRAQSMDVLSSQANIAGYAAVLMAASKLTKVIPLMMTAAGTIKPAKILILGAGVAGLQAIATAKRLGAVVFAYDVRSVVKEQVESLGAKFVDIDLGESAEGSGGYAKALTESAQALLRQKLAQVAKDMDIVITTAQIPGRKAPLLLDDNVFSLMKNGSIIIDMAASSGGNVAGSVVSEWKKIGRVHLYGAENLACMMPKDASFTFSRNLCAMLELLEQVGLNVDDDILQDALICHNHTWINKSFFQFIQANERRP